MTADLTTLFDQLQAAGICVDMDTYVNIYDEVHTTGMLTNKQLAKGTVATIANQTASSTANGEDSDNDDSVPLVYRISAKPEMQQKLYSFSSKVCQSLGRK